MSGLHSTQLFRLKLNYGSYELSCCLISFDRFWLNNINFFQRVSLTRHHIIVRYPETSSSSSSLTNVANPSFSLMSGKSKIVNLQFYETNVKHIKKLTQTFIFLRTATANDAAFWISSWLRRYEGLCRRRRKSKSRLRQTDVQGTARQSPNRRCQGKQNRSKERVFLLFSFTRIIPCSMIHRWY